ncbi:LysR family transcriptional regulator [Cocleimonas flava]|uniref:DNA-binding transcriptional LysR family regulator n=1 Tax=Cocleimonas flava TaxID=634765 RepID=A0A4R1EZ21_9GAMM|nr:LysR family transcriptional regulator [Cocleimonas flava]TCJ85179.1 DNA-binding transcriptional LysR family regulator [Cocleimonas flava]
MLNARALYYLSTIIRRGSLRRAASLIGIDVSSVSRQIRQLEENLDIKLLERHADGSKITEAGRLLVDHYHSQQAAEEATLSHLAELQGVVTGKVRIAVGEGFIADLISEPIRTFMIEHPRVDLEVTMCGVNDATMLIKESEVDLALLYAPPKDKLLHCHVETRQPLDLIVPAGHQFTKSTGPISFQEITKWPIGLMNSSFGMRQMVNAVAHQERVIFDARLHTDSVAVLTNFVRSGIGITFMPELTVSEEVKRGSIEVIPMEHSVLSGARAQIVSFTGREMTVATKACLEQLHKGMRFFNADAPRLVNS